MGYVYIMTNKSNRVLYVGVTTDLVRRIDEHKSESGSRFTIKYNCNKLVFFEVYEEIEKAINRETQLKWWKRQWKIDLIERINPKWEDLGMSLCNNPVLRDSGSSPE